ncbi:MAG: hypothetical protein K1Y02_04480 [Candidatus Hydrogenedentes bacterium]|nr:hypothetical protein [Candidatus Hydrogenedentota bacterium]
MRGRGLFGWLVCAFACAAAWTQDDASMREGEFTVEIPPRFVTAYRDGTWVPVDVIVNNNRKDVSGYVQVELLSAMGVQSPVYAVPAETPKASRKRFRVYCNFTGTSEVQAGVFQKKWRSVDMPTRIALRPIDPQDLLVLVIDDDAPSYGFLYNALQSGATQRAVHRIEIRSNELDLLPEQYACYDAYDAIIMGKTEPAALTANHRSLMERYVQDGGVLIICTGEYGNRYQGTWLEELAGVRISGQTSLSEKALADAALPAGQQIGARDDKQVVLAQLTPQLPEVVVRSKNPVLATRRPIGSGFVAVIGVDAPSKSLQDSPGYLALWQELCEWRPRVSQPNVDAVIQHFTYSMPSRIGIRIVPRSTVIAFLGLYILVGVIGNWVFWSLLKKREMAWVCLVVFSFGFTGYALVFGTAGRAKSTELHEIGIARFPLHGDTVHQNAVTGIISARSAQYSFDLANPDSLVTEMTPLQNTVYGGPSFAGSIRPSRLVQGQPPRLEDFQVGASVFRVCNVESEAVMSGGIQGVITADKSGLHGTLTNSTGWAIESAAILYKGHLINLKGSGPEWHVETSTDVFGPPSSSSIRDTMPAYFRPMRPGDAKLESMRPEITEALLQNPKVPGILDTSLPPLFCGWTSQANLQGIIPAQGMARTSTQTLVVADLEVLYDGLAEVTATPLSPDYGAAGSQMNQSGMFPPGYINNGSIYNLMPIDQSGSTPYSIRIPAAFTEIPEAVVYVDVYWQSEASSIFYKPDAAEAAWPMTHTIETRQVTPNGNRMNLTTYRVEDWKKYYDSTRQSLAGTVNMARTSEGRGRSWWGSFYATARVEMPAETQDRGWTSWQ